jgi:DNA-binding GntR family transcriptional regulator
MSSVSLQASRRTLAGDVYESLRSEILTCRIEPGSKIRINDLCSQMGVNLGAVREALSKLSSEGLVTAEAQKGFRVAPVSRQELVDLTSTRVDIEHLCLTDAIACGDVIWESQIVASLHHLSRLPERDLEDPARLSESWVVAHGAFHLALVAACKNAVKMRIRASLYDQSERYRRLSVPARGHARRDTLAEHKAIAEAVLGRDLSRSTELMASHLNKTTEILLAAPFLEA